MGDRNRQDRLCGASDTKIGPRRFAYAGAALGIAAALALGAVVVLRAPGLRSSRGGAETQQTQAEKGALAGTAPVSSLQPDPAPLPPNPTAEELRLEIRRVAAGLADDFPRLPTAINVQAKVELWLGNSTEALKLWERCLALDGGFGPAYKGTAEAAVQKGDFEKAVAMYRKAVASLPWDRDLPVFLAEALLAAGRPREAEAELTRFAGSGPMAGLAALNLGQARLQLNDLDGAAQAFRTAIDFSSTRRKAHYGLAQVHTRLGENEKARSHMDLFRTLAADERPTAGERARSAGTSTVLRQIAMQVYFEAAGLYQSRGNPQRSEDLRQRAEAIYRSSPPPGK
jgi:tetratricopeptide (TPR) repeat protein